MRDSIMTREALRGLRVHTEYEVDRFARFRVPTSHDVDITAFAGRTAHTSGDVRRCLQRFRDATRT